MHPNTMKHTKRWVWAPMGWIRMFVAKNYNMTSWHELLHLLHQFSMFCNKFHAVTKRSQMHRNIGIGSNGMDWLCSLRKIPTWLRGTNFCNNCTSSPRFAPSFMPLWNDPKCIQTLWNSPKYQFSMFCTNFHELTKRSELPPNTTKHTETLVYGPMVWIWCICC